MPARLHAATPSEPPTADRDGHPTAAELARRREQADTFLSFARLHRMLERRVAELFVREGLSDVTPAQASALMILYRARGPMTARQLAEHMGISQPTVGRFVHALEGGGWVSRQADPTDARAMLIRPTKKAMRSLPAFIRVSNELLDRAFAGFDDASVRRVARTTQRLLSNLGEP